MTVVAANSLTLKLPVYAVHARSLRRTLIQVSTGGLLFRDGHDHVVVQALKDISFRLDDGDRLGVVGHNGSGKSTLLRALAGIYAPTSGSVSVNGKISAVLDTVTGMDPEATGEENIVLLARFRGYGRDEVSAALPDIANFADLGPFLKMPMKTYSAGMVARLAFAVATSFDPDILLMDEWLSAGDSNFVSKAQARLSSYVERSRILVLATHSLSLVESICNKTLWLHHGSIKAFGRTGEVLGLMNLEAEAAAAAQSGADLKQAAQ